MRFRRAHKRRVRVYDGVVRWVVDGVLLDDAVTSITVDESRDQPLGAKEIEYWYRRSA